MTRINCLPVEVLSDKHLLAEYKEITRPFSKVRKRIEDNTMSNLSTPEKYCLGAGHETFFYNKLLFLYLRYQNLCQELIKREVKVNLSQFQTILSSIENDFSHTIYWNNWKPSHEELYLNMARLVNRSNYQSVKDEIKS